MITYEGKIHVRRKEHGNTAALDVFVKSSIILNNNWISSMDTQLFNEESKSSPFSEVRARAGRGFRCQSYCHLSVRPL